MDELELLSQFTEVTMQMQKLGYIGVMDAKELQFDSDEFFEFTQRHGLKVEMSDVPVYGDYRFTTMVGGIKLLTLISASEMYEKGFQCPICGGIKIGKESHCINGV